MRGSLNLPQLIGLSNECFTMADASRVVKELAACAKDEELTGVKAVKVDGSIKHLRGTINGPEGSP